MTEDEVEDVRARYIKILSPLFFPEDPVGNDIVRYFASLLRIVGMEDRGWDPYLESRSLLEDLNNLLQIDLPEGTFPDPNSTQWRLGLLFYSHIVEMDAPYEVLTNLLRFKLGKGYSPNPYHMFLSKKEQKRKGSSQLNPMKKIEIIRTLGMEAGIEVAELFDEFYDNKLRNAVSHSDFIITDDTFRCRGGTGGTRAFKISLERANELITKAKIFIGTIFDLEKEARRKMGEHKGRAIPYDPVYKGMMEILVDDNDLMCGFKVHWPNNSESIYRRADVGIKMTNCMLDLRNATIEFMVGLYAREPGSFSPLVEAQGEPTYTALEGTGEIPVWVDT